MAHYCLLCGMKLKNHKVEGRIRELCEACGWIYYEQRKVSAGVRISQENKLLLVRRGIEPWLGKWYLPAGFVEVDEEPQIAAKREAFEETGLEVMITGLAGVYTYSDDPRGNGVVLMYDAIIQSGQLKVTAETLEVGYFSSDEVDRLSLAGECVQKQVKDWQDFTRNLENSAHA